MASNSATNSPLRRTTVLVFVLFFIGIALGALGASLYLRSRPQPLGHYSHPSRAEIVNRLSHDLDLTPEQKSQIEAIVDNAHKRFHALDVQVEPQYDAIRQDTRSQIRVVLTAEQKTKFEDEVRRLDEQRKKDMQR